VIGQPRRYLKRFLFVVEVDGIDGTIGFETVGPIEAEVGLVEQHEGGLVEVADQSPGKVKWTEVVLTRGATDSRDLYDWFLQVVDAEANAGLLDEEYKRNVSIVARDRDGSERVRWNLQKAWPRKWKGGEWDAKAEENVVEEITLVYQRATRTP
jgi:phage tail-like protein